MTGLGGKVAAVVLGLAVGVLSLLVATPARAATPTQISLSAPAATAGSSTAVVVTAASGGAPLSGATIVVERWDGARWVPLAAPAADAAGTVRVDVVTDRDPERNRLRASYPGDAARDPAVAEGRIPLLQRASSLSLAGPAAVVDETSAALVVRWTADDATPVAAPVELQSLGPAGWTTIAGSATGADGQGGFTLTPREDARLRVVVAGTAWAAAATSNELVVRNLPPGRRVSLPRKAPGPRKRLRPQPRATTPGADPQISTIPDDVWASMVGRSWRRGCPVGRSSLRLLRINYWDFSGYRRRGELIANVNAVRQMAGALSDMYDARLPIRSMRRVDTFGYSKALKGADDHASMAAGNTSAFNCRWVVGRPGVRSPHTYGYALDVNTWENPFRSRRGWTPNRWWVGRSDSRVAWRSRNHRVVRIMARHGLRWTYGRSDAQHFDVVRGRGARPIPGEVPPECRVAALCH